MAINKTVVLSDLNTIDASLITLTATHWPRSGDTQHEAYETYRMHVERIRDAVNVLRGVVTNPTATL